MMMTTGAGAQQESGGKPRKTAAKKAVSRKTTAKKKATRKVTPKKAAAAKKAPAAAKKRPVVSAEDRFCMIQEAAYLIAEKDAFASNPDAYWHQAEAQVRKQLDG